VLEIDEKYKDNPQYCSLYNQALRVVEEDDENNVPRLLELLDYGIPIEGDAGLITACRKLKQSIRPSRKERIQKERREEQLTAQFQIGSQVINHIEQQIKTQCQDFNQVNDSQFQKIQNVDE